MRRKIGWLAVLVAMFGLGQASAQGTIPEGMFVRDSEDNIWLVTGGTRAVVPIFEADDAAILAIPEAGKWVSAMAGGVIVLGNRPEWADDPKPVRLKDDPPKVTIKLSEDEIVRGASLEVTVIATDDISVDWIEWEGEVARSGQDVEDPVLVTIRRFDCADTRECTNTWTVTPTGQGNYVIVARARDKTGQRSDATADLTIR